MQHKNPFYGVDIDELDMIVNWSAYDDYCVFSDEEIQLAREEMNRQSALIEAQIDTIETEQDDRPAFGWTF